MQRRIRAVLRSSHRLAVERHDPFGHSNKAGYPLPKTTLEYLGIQDPKDRAKRIVRWRPVFQRKKSCRKHVKQRPAVSQNTSRIIVWGPFSTVLLFDIFRPATELFES
jgi:hypothetical protein